MRHPHRLTFFLAPLALAAMLVGTLSALATTPASQGVPARFSAPDATLRVHAPHAVTVASRHQGSMTLPKRPHSTAVREPGVQRPPAAHLAAAHAKPTGKLLHVKPPSAAPARRGVPKSGISSSTASNGATSRIAGTAALIDSGSFGTIQAAIDAANPGDTVSVPAGTYTENLVIDKALTLEGAGPSTIIEPAVSEPTCPSGDSGSLCTDSNNAVHGSNVILVQAASVTIQNLTIDGHNPNLTSGATGGGVDLDARNGIVTDYTQSTAEDNLTVSNVTVQNIYWRGIYTYGNSGFTFQGDAVHNVQGDPDSICVFNFGGSGVIESNHASGCNDAISANWSTGTQFLNNTITSSGSGIHTDNNGGSGGTADVIQGNSVSDGSAGAYGVWVFAPYVAPTFSGNTITNVAVGLCSAGGQATPATPVFTNNTVDGQGVAGSTGVYVTNYELDWGYGNESATFTGNVITNNPTEVYLESESGNTLAGSFANNAFTNSAGGVTEGTQSGQSAGTVSVSMLNNWWGSANGPSNAANTFNMSAQGLAVPSGVPFAPWLKSGTNTINPPAPGFQPAAGTSFAPVSVSAPSGQYASIQAGIDAASAGATVSVVPGSYNETAANRSPVKIAGTYQFGLFISTNKNGITVQGVDASGNPITAWSAVGTTITTNSTADFGPDGVFVEGDNVTLAGLGIAQNLDGENKTIEILGNNFTLKGCNLEDIGGSVYFNDVASTGTTSYIQTYDILNNNFHAGLSLDITNGAGLSGPASGRVVQGNAFDAGYTSAACAAANGGSACTWPEVSYDGSGTGVAWFVNSVGGATLSGNSFVDGAQYIRARGTYDNTTYDWAGYWAHNTFDRSAVDGPNPPGQLTPYTYTSSGYTFNNVRHISGLVQTEVADANAGDTVLMAPGTYVEQLKIAKNLTLSGAGTGTIVQSPASLAKSFSVAGGPANLPVVWVHNAQAALQSFEVDGAGQGNANYRLDGVAYYDVGGTINGLKVVRVRDQPFDGMQAGVGIYAYVDSSPAQSLNVTNNTVTDFQKTGIALGGAGLSVSVSGNTITGQGPTTLNAQNGIEVIYGAAGTIGPNNTISGISYTPDNWDASSVLLYGPPSGAIIVTNNTITGGQAGVYDYGYPATVSGNTISSSQAATGVPDYEGVIVNDPPHSLPSPFVMAGKPGTQAHRLAAPQTALNTVQATVNNNVLSGGSDSSESVGLELDAGWLGDNPAIAATGNALTGWGTGVLVHQASSSDQGYVGGTFAGLTFRQNSISGNTMGMNANSAVNAANNWWGSVFGPGGVGLGWGDAISTLVSYMPWSGDSASTTTGHYVWDVNGDGRCDVTDLALIGIHWLERGTPLDPGGRQSRRGDRHKRPGHRRPPLGHTRSTDPVDAAGGPPLRGRRLAIPKETSCTCRTASSSETSFFWEIPS